MITVPTKPEAITAVFPQATVQTCIVHLLRHSLDFVSWKDRKPVAAALKEYVNNPVVTIIVQEAVSAQISVIGEVANNGPQVMNGYWNRPDADAIVLACTNWKTMGVLEQLEQELGKPVLSTTQVSIWAALQMIGETAPIDGYGKLLREI